MQTSAYALVTLNPQAQYDWQKVVIQNPLDRSIKSLDQLLAEKINVKGTHLVRFEVSVEILASQPIEADEKPLETLPVLAPRPLRPKLNGRK